MPTSKFINSLHIDRENYKLGIAIASSLRETPRYPHGDKDKCEAVKQCGLGGFPHEQLLNPLGYPLGYPKGR